MMQHIDKTLNLVWLLSFDVVRGASRFVSILGGRVRVLYL
jgi:hypothetical protein